MAMPLGNLGPYFILSVSTTFFDISTKPLLSLIPYFKKKKSSRGIGKNHILPREGKLLGMKGMLLHWGPVVWIFCYVPPKKVGKIM